MVSNTTFVYLVSFFLVFIGVLVPFINADFDGGVTEYDAEGLGEDFDRSSIGASISFWQVISSVAGMFFWTFGVLPVWIDLLIFVPLRISLIYAIVKGH